MFVFLENLASNTRFEIRHFGLLPTNFELETEQEACF